MPTVQVLEEAAVPVWIRTTTPCQVAGEVVFAQGCSIHKWLPVASEYCMNSAGNHGVDIDWYAGDKFHGKPVVTRQRNHTDLFLWDSAPIENVGPEWSAIVKTSLMPTVSRKHSISFMSVGPGKLYVHGQLALNLAAAPVGTQSTDIVTLKLRQIPRCVCWVLL